MFPIALLDACVLYPAPIRDLLLNFAEADLFKPKWTGLIHEEWKRNLILNRPTLDPERINRTISLMNEAFPYSLVEDFDHLIEVLNLPDPDDRHVLASAVVGEAEFLVTSNLRDFPESNLQKFDITPIHPDNFALLLIEVSPTEAFGAFENMIANLKNPPLDMEQVLQTLKKCGLEKTSDLLKKLRIIKAKSLI